MADVLKPLRGAKVGVGHQKRQMCGIYAPLLSEQFGSTDKKAESTLHFSTLFNRLGRSMQNLCSMHCSAFASIHWTTQRRDSYWAATLLSPTFLSSLIWSSSRLVFDKLCRRECPRTSWPGRGRGGLLTSILRNSQQSAPPSSYPCPILSPDHSAMVWFQKVSSTM